MAEKKSVFKIILDAVTVLLAVLLVAFVALPYIGYKLAGESVGDMNVSGFDCISFDEGAPVGTAVVLILLLIFASLLIISGLAKILVDFGVIKSEKAVKAVKVVMILSAVLSAILAIASIFTVAIYCGDHYSSEFNTGLVPMYATLVINAIIAIVTIATTAISAKK